MLPDELRKNIREVDQWLEQLGSMPKLRKGLSAEERKQLQTVSKAIGQLQRADVPVPEDLRRLKLELSARDVSDKETGPIIFIWPWERRYLVAVET